MATAVISFTKTIRVTPTITTSAYASGDSIGGAITLPNAARQGRSGGVILSLSVVDKDAEEVGVTVQFYKNAPTATDNAAFDPTDAQLADDYIGEVALTSYTSLSDNSVASERNIGLAFESESEDAQDIYAVIISNGTPTYTAASDIVLIVNILQD